MVSFEKIDLSSLFLQVGATLSFLPIKNSKIVQNLPKKVFIPHWLIELGLLGGLIDPDIGKK